MATYRVQGPGGKNYTFDAPPGLSEDQIQIIKNGLFEPAPAPVSPPEPPKGETGFIPSVMRGGRGLYSLLGDVAPAMLGKLVGAEDYAKRQMQEAAEYQKETERLYPSEVPSFTNIKDVGSALTYVKESIGEAIPSIIPSLFTGGAASFLARGAVGAATQAAERTAAQEVARAAAKNRLTDETLEAIKKTALDAGVKEAQQIALKYEVGGALAGSAAQNIPDVYQNLYEKAGGNLPDLGPALVSGSFNAVLDAITPINILRKARTEGISNKALTGAWYKRAGVGAAEGFLTEGGTEALQEMSSAAAEKFVDNNRNFFTPENFVRFIDAGLKGGFGGAGITAATNVAFGRKAAEPPPAAPPSVEETETIPTKPVVDIESREFKRKQQKYEDYQKGIQELEALGDQLTSSQKGVLTRRRNAAAKLKSEIDEALGQAPAEGEERDIVSRAAKQRGAGARFEISEEPAGLGVSEGAGEPGAAGVAGAPVSTALPGEGAGAKPPPLAAAPAPAPAPAALTAAPPAPAITTTTKAPSKAQADLDELDSLLGGKTLPTAGTARRTQAQIELDNKVDALATRYGLTRNKGETTQELGQRIRDAVEFAKRTETEPVSDIEAAQVTKQTLKKEEPYFAPQEQRDLYEETAEQFNAGIDEETKRTYDSTYAEELQAGKDSGLSDADAQKKAKAAAEAAVEGAQDEKLPKYRELSDDERRRYFQTHIQQNNQLEHDQAAQALSSYLASKRQESRVGASLAETKARDSYNRERSAFGAKTSFRYKFPAWNSLSQESKKLYSDINKNDTALEQNEAFRAVKEQIRKETAEKQKREVAAQFEAETTLAGQQELERALAKQPAGKGEKLPKEVRDALVKGDIKAALDYLKEHGQGLKARKYNRPGLLGYGMFYPRVIIRDSIARAVFRNLSSVLSEIPDFRVNVVVDENMAVDSLGEYDASTNTIYLSPGGLDESTLLHELTHAATVKIIHQYFTDKSKLTPRARAAVEHIQNIASAAKARLGSEFPNAFENLYEFVAYAMTDMEFQSALARIQVGEALTKTTKPGAEFTAEEAEEREAGNLVPPPEKTLWNYFTDTLAWLYKLFTPFGKRQEILLPTERTAVTTAARETLLKREEARKNRLAEKRRKAREELEEAPEEEVAEAPEFGKKPSLEDEAEFEAVTTKETEELFDIVSEEEKAAATIAAEKDELVIQNGLTNLRRGILREPGYKGNVLLEVAAAFQDLMAAPEGGIERLAGAQGVGTRLQAKAAPVTKKAPVGKAPSQYTDEEFKAQVSGEVGLQPQGSKEFLRGLMSRRGYDWFVQKFQNERQVVKKIFERAEKFGIVKRVGEGINDVWGQITRSTGMAVDLYATHMKPLADEIHAGVEAYAQKLGIPIKEALENLHLILEARHEPERRHIKYLLNVPLDDKKKYKIKGFVDDKGKPLSFSAEGWREHILTQLTRADLAPNEAARVAEVNKLRTLLEQIVADKKMHATIVEKVDKRGKKTTRPVGPADFDEDSELYSVIAGRTPDDIRRITRLYDLPEHKAEIDAIADAIKKVHGETTRLNREANYWSVPVQNVVDFYGYENYVPFKGRPEDEALNLDSKRIGGELQELQGRFEGRTSESDNPLLQSLAEGAQAAMRAGRKDLTLAIKNAIKDKILIGELPKEKIQFADRYLRGETKKELGGPDKIFHYNEDGTIDVLRIRDKGQLEAIRRSFRTSQPIIDIINSLTSGIGQTHTRYNPAFAPMNFVRDSLTNAFTLGAELGPVKAGQLIKNISAEVASGGLYRAMNFSNLYSAGKFNEIQQLAGGAAPYTSLNEEQRYYRDLLDYVKLGGKVSYLQGVAAKGALDGLMKEIGRSGILKNKDQIDKFFDIYNEMFELAARVGAYRTLREDFVANGESPEEAQVHAVEYAKNLANFEQVGEWGKAAGALFMFFRPAATGAVRAIDSLRPAFGFNEENFRAEAQAQGRTAEEIDRAVEEMKKQRDSARAMSASLAGLGVAVYFMSMMMSGDDDKKRNRVATDDMARWSRYARFFIPGFENPIQIPWGFGLGAFAAAGAQIASLASGRVSLADVGSNIMAIGLDSFLPLPFSRISPIDNFPAFALDSITPSVARPFFEYVMNLDGLGREIYNNRQTRYGDAYTGGDSIPELYKSAARTLFKATGGAVDWSPNTLYFFASNYMDGAMKAISAGYNMGLTLAGQKDFDPKNDALLASSFIGTKSNVDAREFSKAETYIKGLEKQVNALKDKPDMLVNFAKNNPDKMMLVQIYNQQVNGSLRTLREAANKIRVSELSPRERKAQLDQIINMQNTVKRQILNGFEAVAGYRP